MKKFLTLFAIGMLMMALPSCTSGDDSTGPENPTPDKPNIQTIFTIDSNGVYVVDDLGGQIIVKVATNVNYSVHIPSEAKSWLSVADTRSDVRMETLTFTVAKNTSSQMRSANVSLIGSDGKTLQTLIFKQVAKDAEPSEEDEAIFIIDTNGNYVVDDTGGTVTVKVTTNVDYTVQIPSEAKSWLSVADTRGSLRQETLTFTISRNTSSEARNATVTFADSDGKTLGKVTFKQVAKDEDPNDEPGGDEPGGDEPGDNPSDEPTQTNPNPANQIWYTTTDNQPVTLWEEYDFGVELISNTYTDGLGVLSFDGDITKIGASSFEGRENLQSIIIPDQVTTIEEYALASCISLEEVALPNSLLTIGEGAFSCTSLEEVTLPNSLLTIGVGAFAESALKSVTIPNSVTEIGPAAFGYCCSLVEFNSKFASEDKRCLIIDNKLVAFAPCDLEDTRYLMV